MHTGLRKTTCGLWAATCLAFASGCATTVEDRIRKDRELFYSYPPEVQDQIRAGKIEPGDPEELVRMALGDPDRVRTRVTDEATDEVWVYVTARPRFSVGVGVGTGGRHTGVGTGVGVHTGGRHDDAMRVIFRDGIVHAIEAARDD